MNVRELVDELQDWLRRNEEPELESYVPDAEIRIEDEEGTYDSPLLAVVDANGPHLIVKYPHDDCDAEEAPIDLEAALKSVKSAGYVVLKEKSYRQAQERQRVAEALRKAEERAAEDARHWAINCLDEQRRLADRLTFVYGVARAHGATVEELKGE